MVNSIIQMENARIIFRNFSGKPSKFNPAGSKNFDVILPNDMAIDLINEGWYVKQFRDNEETGEPGEYHMTVKVKYSDFASPKVYIVTKKKKTLLDEETIGQLDVAEIENVDLVFRPYNWNVPGKSGVTAYLKEMYVTIVEDVFANKYSFED